MRTIFIIIIGTFIFSLSTNGQFSPTQVKDNTLLVKGTAILKQMPEMIYVYVDVKSESQDYSDCQIKVLSKMEKVKASMLKQNIKYYSMNTDYLTVLKTL